MRRRVDFDDVETGSLEANFQWTNQNSRMPAGGRFPKKSFDVLEENLHT